MLFMLILMNCNHDKLLGETITSVPALLLEKGLGVGGGGVGFYIS